MSTEANKAIVRRATAALNAFDWDTLAEVMAPELVEGLKASPFPGAFPDVHITIEEQIAEGDKVVSRWTDRGTHQGEFMGIAPTGKRIEYTGISIDRIADGKIVESLLESDRLGLMRQLGAVTEPGQSES
jgi:predicted ester cyclase